nr:glycosyltransferase [Paenibacillus spiritus]
MKKKMLIASYDMEIGGVERSLAALLEHLDYERFDVDLMLYRHQGELMDLIPDRVNLLKEDPAYATFRHSVKDILRSGRFRIAGGRLLARFRGEYVRRRTGITEPGYYQMQLMWKHTLPYLPSLNKRYDIAVSYLWPHDFVAEKVEADLKLAWIHTDYSTIFTDRGLDYERWSRFDRIVAVSEACRDAFLVRYPELASRVGVMENLCSPDSIRKLAAEPVPNPVREDAGFKLVTVGRLSSAKGIDLAVEALRLLRSRGYDDIRWYVVGYGGEEPAIRGLVEQHGLADSFFLLGKQVNPYPYMAACDLYVQPSRYEGKAVAITEAQILGKPVLITRYPTAASQIRNEEDGLIVELSPEGVAEGIERLYRDALLRNRLAENGGLGDHSGSGQLEALYGFLNLEVEAR